MTDIEWTDLKSLEHLAKERVAAKERRRPVVVFVHAAQCWYSQKYWALFRETAVRTALSRFEMLSLDTTESSRIDLIRALGAVWGATPQIVFFDHGGHRDGKSVPCWWEDDSEPRLLERLCAVR